MNTLDTTESQPKLLAARELLEERGVFEANQPVTPKELTRELNRRGWRSDVVNGSASVTKAYVPPGTTSQTLREEGPDQLTALTIVLAEAIRFDDERGLSSIEPYRADLIVRAPDEHVIALVEVKNLASLTGEAARSIRRNLIDHGRMVAQVPFFLLVSQDIGYLWDGPAVGDPFSAPTVEFPMSSVVTYYLPWLEGNRRLGGQALSLAVATWLTDLANDRLDRPRDVERYLDATGFLASIGGSRISAESSQ